MIRKRKAGDLREFFKVRNDTKTVSASINESESEDSGKTPMEIEEQVLAESPSTDDAVRPEIIKVNFKTAA